MPHKSADSQHLQVEWNETLDYKKLTQKEKSIKTRILTLQINYHISKGPMTQQHMILFLRTFWMSPHHTW